MREIKSMTLFRKQSGWIACGMILLQSLCGPVLRGEITADLPASLPPDRYEQMVKKSPFALATPVVVAPVTPPFASTLYVTGIAKIGNADFVSISSRDSQTKLSLLAGEPGQDDISLVSIDWSEQIGKSKVTIKKGTEFAVLQFDQAALQTPIQVTPQIPPPMPQGGQPGGPPMPQGGPGGRRIILPNQPNAGPNQPGIPPGGRQRIRIINSKPQ